VEVLDVRELISNRPEEGIKHRLNLVFITDRGVTNMRRSFPSWRSGRGRFMITPSRVPHSR